MARGGLCIPSPPPRAHRRVPGASCPGSGAAPQTDMCPPCPPASRAPGESCRASLYLHPPSLARACRAQRRSGQPRAAGPPHQPEAPPSLPHCPPYRRQALPAGIGPHPSPAAKDRAGLAQGGRGGATGRERVGLGDGGDGVSRAGEWVRVQPGAGQWGPRASVQPHQLVPRPGREEGAWRPAPHGYTGTVSFWNQFSTVCWFSFTQLMLARVLSSACSSARVPDPKPTSWLSALNCSSCQGGEGLQ